MNAGSLIALASLILLFGLASKRLQAGSFTPPMAFVLYGMLLGAPALGLLEIDAGEGAVHGFAELALILVLFLDASRIDLRKLRSEFDLPLRMLAIGMPLTLLLGAAVALGVFAGLSFVEAALLAAILTPTDAALGQAVVSDPAVPVRIRQSLNVESGLNDGIALPAVLVFAALAEAETRTDVAPWVQYALLQVGLGPLVGVAVGYAGGKVVSAATARGWMNHDFQQLAGIAIALLCWGVAEEVGGNGFIAAFVGGLTVGNTARHVCSCLYEFTEVEGQLLILITFSLFGAALVWPVVEHWSAATWLYAALSLTVVRMLPVALSLLGTGLHPVSYVFLGWFGPRGLASILFGLLILEHAGIPNRDAIFAAVIATVLLSVALHGVSAAPAARAYARRLQTLRGAEAMEEHKSVTELPLRQRYAGTAGTEP